MSFVERRQSVRYTVDRCTALYRRRRLFFLWESRPNRAPVVDLSTHGIGFYAKHGLHPGHAIRIAFEMPSEACAIPPGIEVTAEVRWVNPAKDEPELVRVGCIFRRLTPEQRDLIARILQCGVARPQRDVPAGRETRSADDRSKSSGP